MRRQQGERNQGAPFWVIFFLFVGAATRFIENLLLYNVLGIYKTVRHKQHV